MLRLAEGNDNIWHVLIDDIILFSGMYEQALEYLERFKQRYN